jgi:PTS system nitrogen regulatory IIA component
MRFADLLDPSRIKIPIEARDKPGVLRELAELVATDRNGDLEEIVEAVQEREAAMSTGIGHGVAIPHGRSSSLAELRLAAGRSDVPVPFESADGQPASLFFLLIGPESAAGDHVRALSRIARVTRQATVREQLLSARTPEEFYRLLCEADTN